MPLQREADKKEYSDVGEKPGQRDKNSTLKGKNVKESQILYTQGKQKYVFNHQLPHT